MDLAAGHIGLPVLVLYFPVSDLLVSRLVHVSTKESTYHSAVDPLNPQGGRLVIHAASCRRHHRFPNTNYATLSTMTDCWGSEKGMHMYQLLQYVTFRVPFHDPWEA